VSERTTQRGEGEIGTCHVCGATFATQEELSKHLIDADDGLGTADGPGAQDPDRNATRGGLGPGN
jgi:hypothetical protein